MVLVPLSTTFKVSATKGGAPLTVGPSSVGVFSPVSVFECGQLDDKPTQEIKQLLRPDAAGVLRPARIVRTKHSETWTFQLDEVKRLLEIFAGALSGFKSATATIWVPDPQDTTGNVSLKSETDFSCTVARDGDMMFGNADFSKSTVKVESQKNGAIAWTADGVA